METTEVVPGTTIARKTGSHPAVANGTGPFGKIMLFAGAGGQSLSSEIAGYLGLPMGVSERIVFPNENIFIRLEHSVRGQDVYLVQCMCTPLHDNIMELLIMIDALKRDSAGRINVVIPYLPYTRSDKKDQPRVPITARLMANMIEVAGADRYITIDLHAGQIQGFFNIPGDALTAFHLMSDYAKSLEIPNLVVCSADLGYAKKARNWAEKLGTPLAVVEKRRLFNTGQAEALTIIGDVEGKNVLLVDDEVLTGGTIVKAVEAIRKFGAQDVYLAFTHALLRGEAPQRLNSLNLKQIITTNTMPMSDAMKEAIPNMKVLSVAPMLGEVILRAHEGRSVGELFNEAPRAYSPSEPVLDS
ncbi:MAG TPA: ribose-phosphate diphosphokinase [Aggregatilineales bacterium]|nr:ribose-phosphate diphosphokinase [Aggregatilineales bacterium]